MTLCLSLLFASCGGSGNDEPEPTVYTRTVLVYMAGHNTLSKFVADDLEEMKSGVAALDANSGLRLLVYIDTGTSPRLVELKKVKNEVVEVSVASYESRNSVGVSEMKEVFDDVFNNSDYKADSYGLVFWSHGDGWVPYPLASSRWIGQDKEDGGDYRLNLSDWVTVLQGAPHFDFILMDACFVASVEVAYELRSYTDYYMGSPTETPGPGAPYDKLVAQMAATGSDVAVKMGEAYYAHYEALYNENKTVTNTNWTGGVSISVLKTAALPQLATATKQLLQGEADNDVLRISVFDYDQRADYATSYVGYFDMAQLMQRLAGSDAAYATWKTSFDAAVAYWNTTPQNYSSVVGRFSMTGTNGVTHYIPGSSESKTDVAYRATAWYTAAGFSAIGW